ncbi:hypothetical protein [Nonomuraea longicatena]|uniref:hypothetical protein n=1 Tax=Nonomuraea longicatena TaxID=83682 RepID=UPI0031D5AF96
MSVGEALAAVLSSERELALLRADPERLRRRYALTEGELAMVMSARSPGSEVTSRGVVRLVRSALEACVPVTVAEVGRDAGLWAEFVSVTVRRPPPVGVRVGVSEARQLAAWLEGRGLGGLGCYARYELAKAELLRERSAPAGSGWPLLSPAVRLVEFEVDVTAGPPLRGLPVRRTFAVLQRVRDPACVRTYRISEATAELLRLCDGSRDVEQVVAAAGGQARAMLARLAAARLVVARGASGGRMPR